MAGLFKREGRAWAGPGGLATEVLGVTLPSLWTGRISRGPPQRPPNPFRLIQGGGWRVRDPKAPARHLTLCTEAGKEGATEPSGMFPPKWKGLGPHYCEKETWKQGR